MLINRRALQRVSTLHSYLLALLSTRAFHGAHYSPVLGESVLLASSLYAYSQQPFFCVWHFCISAELLSLQKYHDALAEVESLERVKNKNKPKVEESFWISDLKAVQRWCSGHHCHLTTRRLWVWIHQPELLLCAACMLSLYLHGFFSASLTQWVILACSFL